MLKRNAFYDGGGTEETLEKVYPVLDCFSKTITLQGVSWCWSTYENGQPNYDCWNDDRINRDARLCKAAGLDMDKVLQTVGAGSAANWSLRIMDLVF